jgi:hypothetical protein
VIPVTVLRRVGSLPAESAVFPANFLGSVHRGKRRLSFGLSWRLPVTVLTRVGSAAGVECNILSYAIPPLSFETLLIQLWARDIRLINMLNSLSVFA